jgi:hypothetical protein
VKRDLLQRFVALRQQLEREREAIQTRIFKIDVALGRAREQIAIASMRSRRPRRNSMSLRDAVQQVLRSGPMNRYQIFEAVQRQGYRFVSRHPLQSLATTLYRNRDLFKSKSRGVFSLE